MRAPNLVHFRNLTLAFAVLGAARGVAAVPTAASNVDRPIAGFCTVQSAPPEPVGPGQIRVVIDGVCQMSHLGRADVHIDEIVTYNPDGSAEGVAQTTMTAADGDVLHARGLAHFEPPTAQGIVLFAGDQVFTGGTGRFSGATGQADILKGLVSLVTYEAGYEIDGRIIY